MVGNKTDFQAVRHLCSSRKGSQEGKKRRHPSPGGARKYSKRTPSGDGKLKPSKTENAVLCPSISTLHVSSECLLSDCFVPGFLLRLISFGPYCNPMRQALLTNPLHRWESGGSGELKTSCLEQETSGRWSCSTHPALIWSQTYTLQCGISRDEFSKWVRKRKRKQRQ